LKLPKYVLLLSGKEVMEMAIETITPGHHVPEHAWEHTALRTELLLALGAVVLSIVGLAGLFPMHLAAISIIALGAVLLFQGASVAWHFSELLHQAGASKAGVAEVGGGITTEFLAGLAGLVVGVLALIGIAPMTLCSAGVITFSAALLMTSGEASWMHSLEAKDDERMRHLMYFMTSAAAGAQVLVGLAGLVLGILALVGIAPMLMILIGVLIIGASVVLRSSAIGGLLLKFLHI
jgi:hypothetical protein